MTLNVNTTCKRTLNIGAIFDLIIKEGLFNTSISVRFVKIELTFNEGVYYCYYLRDVKLLYRDKFYEFRALLYYSRPYISYDDFTCFNLSREYYKTIYSVNHLLNSIAGAKIFQIVYFSVYIV